MQRSVSNASNSTTSKSATSVSASSTRALASNDSLGIGTPVTAVSAQAVLPDRECDPRLDGTAAGRSASHVTVRFAAGRIEAQRSCDHGFGDLGEPKVVAEGVRPQLHQGLSDADPELDGDHPGCLMYDVSEVGALLQRGRESAGRRVRLQEDQGMRGDVGHDECVGVLLVGETRRSLAE